MSTSVGCAQLLSALQTLTFSHTIIAYIAVTGMTRCDSILSPPFFLFVCVYICLSVCLLLLALLSLLLFFVQSHGDAILCASFTPADDRTIVMAGKQHVTFWTLDGCKLTKKAGLFEVSVSVRCRIPLQQQTGNHPMSCQRKTKLTCRITFTKIYILVLKFVLQRVSTVMSRA